MAVVVIATVPILMVYPFLQRYFTKGGAGRRDQGLTVARSTSDRAV